MATTITRIQIDDMGNARVFYTKDGEDGAAFISLKNSAELSALKSALATEVDKLEAARATPEGRAAERAARKAAHEAKRAARSAHR